jgi:DNA-binding CsgD family transcriptional regulator
LLALVEVARGRQALAAERFAEAYEHFHRIFDPQHPAHHPFVRGWVLADLVESALHGDRGRDVPERAIAELGRVAERTRAPHLLVQLSLARAMLAADSDGETDADGRFRAAIVETADWPSYRARAQLAYGIWLRRQRRYANSRVPLRDAAGTFDALGLTRLGERARRELRASGETARKRVPEAWSQLTPQELQIAELAAEGLSNREIGERLYLSPRTIGSHLYRLFPKLGITSRAQLGAALGSTLAP